MYLDAIYLANPEAGTFVVAKKENMIQYAEGERRNLEKLLPFDEVFFCTVCAAAASSNFWPRFCGVLGGVLVAFFFGVWAGFMLRVSLISSGIEPKKFDTYPTFGTRSEKIRRHKMSDPTRPDPFGSGSIRVPLWVEYPIPHPNFYLPKNLKGQFCSFVSNKKIFANAAGQKWVTNAIMAIPKN